MIELKKGHKGRMKIHDNSIVGQDGVYLIARIVSGMGFLWQQSGGVEAGIDGIIEIRDAESGEVTNSIIQVQSKATKGNWTAETDTHFEYLCDARHLAYWMNGNAPVILVVSRPATNEAYWVSIKDYFKDPSLRLSRKIHFDKREHKFDSSCRSALIKLAIPKDAGVYFAPLPKNETLFTNLLPVVKFAPRLYIAATECREAKEMWNTFRTLDQRVGSEWILKNKSIISFHDLREYPWDRVCDVGSVEDFDVEEWALSSDEETKKEFVWLLNGCLRQLAWHRRLRYDRNKDIVHFRATPDLRKKEIQYPSVTRRARREVFGPHEITVNKQKIIYYRHSAFWWRFVRFEDQWYLSVNPTYHFTRDGRIPLVRKHYARRLAGIKKLEKNPALLGQLLMWSSVLQYKSGGLFPDDEYEFLQLGQLKTFEVDFGMADAEWLKHEEDKNLQASLHLEEGLFSQ